MGGAGKKKGVEGVGQNEQEKRTINTLKITYSLIFKNADESTLILGQSGRNQPRSGYGDCQTPIQRET